MYAVTRSFLAPWVTASPSWLVPPNVTDPKPVSAGVGKVPTSPVIVVAPVLVIPEPARTAKLPAVPRPTGACAAYAADPPAKTDAARRTVATGAT
jgi:hypothetical protein